MKKTILVSAGWILAAGMIGTALPGQAVLAAKRVTSESGETSSEGKSQCQCWAEGRQELRTELYWWQDLYP